jgi:hypothetical protein
MWIKASTKRLRAEAGSAPERRHFFACAMRSGHDGGKRLIARHKATRRGKMRQRNILCVSEICSELTGIETKSPRFQW